MLSAYYYWRPMYDGYECLQLLEQNGGFGNNGAQPPMQIHNVHNSAGKRLVFLDADVMLCVGLGQGLLENINLCMFLCFKCFHFRSQTK